MPLLGKGLAKAYKGSRSAFISKKKREKAIRTKKKEDDYKASVSRYRGDHLMNGDKVKIKGGSYNAYKKARPRMKEHGGHK